jgi:hypothetical protein
VDVISDGLNGSMQLFTVPQQKHNLKTGKQNSSFAQTANIALASGKIGVAICFH